MRATTCASAVLVLEPAAGGRLIPGCRDCGWRGRPCGDRVAAEAALGLHVEPADLAAGIAYLDVAGDVVLPLSVPAGDPAAWLRLRLRRELFEALALHTRGDRRGWRVLVERIRRHYPPDAIVIVLAEVRRSRPLNNPGPPRPAG